MSEISSESKEMQDVLECQSMIKMIVPRDSRSIQEWITATARKLGWTYTRTKDVWYADARRIDGHEKEQLKAIKAKRDADTASEKRIARNEYAELCDRISRLETALAIADEDHGRPLIDALRAIMGRVDSARDSGA